MILEVALLNVHPQQTAEFEAAFTQAAPIIASMRGYVAHELQRCLEVPPRYVLLVRWQTLADHTIGFRASPQGDISAEYQEWRRLLHHFYDPFPTVEHFELVHPMQGHTP
jgi:heme-degrading monooxygenase HmoA